MAKLTLATGIVAGEPTAALNIYPRELLDRAVKLFNMRANKRPVPGGELDPTNIDDISNKSFTTRQLFINESGMLCADIELDDTEAGRKLLDKINNSIKVIARPIMCIPSYVKVAQENKNGIKPLEISKLTGILRVQVECDGKSTGSDTKNHTSGQ